MPKQNKYESIELDWAESQLKTWKEFVDANPYHLMKDRITLKETKNGGFIPVTCATVEQQQKNIRETVKEYLTLFEVVKNLRRAEEARAAKGYGGASESPRMRRTDEESQQD